MVRKKLKSIEQSEEVREHEILIEPLFVEECDSTLRADIEVKTPRGLLNLAVPMHCKHVVVTLGARLRNV